MKEAATREALFDASRAAARETPFEASRKATGTPRGERPGRQGGGWARSTEDAG